MVPALAALIVSATAHCKLVQSYCMSSCVVQAVHCILSFSAATHAPANVSHVLGAVVLCARVIWVLTCRWLQDDSLQQQT